MRIEHHPRLNVWVREDGCVYIPQSGPSKAHWTFGNNCGKGYRCVKIGGKNHLVHRLVVQAFIGEIPPDCEIDHINRVRDCNRLENLRIVSSSENHRNTSSHDRVTEQGRTHSYEDGRQYRHEKQARYLQEKRKTHKHVRFSDGSMHWIPNEGAVLLLAIPLNERIFKE